MSASDDIEGKTPSLGIKARETTPEYEEYQRLDLLFTEDRRKVLVRKIEYVEHTPDNLPAIKSSHD